MLRRVAQERFWADFWPLVRCSGGVHAYARCGKVLKLSLLEATSRGICGWGSSNLVGVGAWFDSVVATCMGRRGAEEIGRMVSSKISPGSA
jgi:hypothetical protein